MYRIPMIAFAAIAMAACASTDHRMPASAWWQQQPHDDMGYGRVYETPYFPAVSDAEIAKAGIRDYSCKKERGGGGVFTAKWDRGANCQLLTTTHSTSQHCLVKIEGSELTYGLIKGRDNTGATELIRIHLHGKQSQIDDSDGMGKFYEDATCTS